MTRARPVRGDDHGSAGDGRRRRSERSRQQIVKAMLTLIRGGHVHPSAAEVAAAAGVGVRTVFRHFEEMDELRREMVQIVEAEVLPIVEAPLVARTWQSRLIELVERRARIYERVMPIKVAAGLDRFRSAYLMRNHRRFLAMERAGLERVLPASVGSRARLLEALDAVMGFQTWRRLRQDQRLSEEESACVMRFVVERLVADR